MALFLGVVDIQNVNIHTHYKALKKVRMSQSLSKSAKNVKHNKISYFCNDEFDC